MRLLLPLLLVSALHAADPTLPGKITTPFPTIQHLAIEWQIEGDDDLDATCEVSYRKQGDSAWIPSMPLRRVPAGKSQKTSPIVTWTNRFSGSVFDLEPGTAYEIALNLHDPDGGSAKEVIRTATRPEPVASAEAVIHPGGKSDLNGMKPGEVLLLEDGDYGAVTFQRDGEPGKPIVYRSPSGKAVFREISLTNRKWVYLEGVTVNGPIRLNGTEHCVIRRCRLHSQFGIKAYLPGMLNACVEDNVITGIREWKPDIMGAAGDNEGEGIQFTGSGNVIRYNRVQGFRDCISFMEDDGAGVQQCNDIHHNDILAGLDDGIEADFAWHNCRILRNRLTNCFVGISSQPGLGGPNYFMRNVLFNIIHEPFKLHRFSRGDVILHNTVIKAGDGFGIYTSEAFDEALIEHNLFIGGKPPTTASFGGYRLSRGRALDVQSIGDRVVMDHNVYVVMGQAFEGKWRSTTFTTLPGKTFETQGRMMEVKAPYPDHPEQFYPPPDLTSLQQAGAYADEARLPSYGPR